MESTLWEKEEEEENEEEKEKVNNKWGLLNFGQFLCLIEVQDIF